MKGTEAKESTWKQATSEEPNLNLKSSISSEQRTQMIQKIKGQTNIGSVKEVSQLKE